MPIYRIILTVASLLAFISQPVTASAVTSSLTHFDLMSNLVDTLGYSFGLPDTPQENDYIKLLDGGRSYRFEAETFRNLDDLVAVNSFTSFGEFSGPGWVSAISMPTTMRMNFLLPHTGTYRLIAAVRLSGHTLTMDGQSWLINDNHPRFQRIDLGETTLAAGMKELTITMPPNGSFDYIELLASPSTPIVPLGGWNPSAPMTDSDLAVTAIRALDLEDLLPLGDEKISFEAEDSSTDETFLTDQRHLGEPRGGRWLRSGAGGGRVTLTFQIPTEAVYTINLIAAGSAPLTGTIDGLSTWHADFPPYLDQRTIGTWFLTVGEHQLAIDLPPRCGIDQMTLLRRRSTAADYRTLAGLPAGDDYTPTDANRLLTLLTRLQSRD